MADIQDSDSGVYTALLGMAAIHLVVAVAVVAWKSSQVHGGDFMQMIMPAF